VARHATVRKWAWMAGRGRCTASSWAQRAVRVDWGLSSTHKALRHGSHSFTCKQHHACLSFVSVHQTALPQLRQQTSSCSLLLIYRPRKNERLSWPGWLTYSGWFAHVSGHPSATGRAQDKESSPAKDRRYTVVPRDRPT